MTPRTKMYVLTVVLCLCGRQLMSAADNDPLVQWLPYFPFLRHMAHLPDFHAFLGELGLKWRWRRAGRDPASAGRPV